MPADLPQSKGKPNRQAPVPAKAVNREADGTVQLPSRIADDAVATIILRDAYTRDRHVTMMRVVMGLLISLGMSLGSNFYLVTRPPVIKFIAMDREGRVVPLTPLDQPINTQSDVATWITQSVAKAYTMSFANYKQEQSAAEENFTPAGWSGFQKALKDSQFLQTVIENKFVTTAAPTAAPVLIQKGHLGEAYAWKFQLPIVVTFQSANRNTSQNLLVDVIVVRQSETEQPRGLGIAQIIAQ